MDTKRFFVLLVLVGLVGCVVLSCVGGSVTTQIGLTSAGGYQTGMSANVLIFEQFSTTGLIQGTYDIDNGSVWACNVGWAKLVVLDASRHITAISNPVQITSIGIWNFTFSGSPTVSVTGGIIGVGLISGTGGTINYWSGSQWATDTSNDYDNPSDPLDVAYAGANVAMWITCTLDLGAPTPTPTVSPSVSPSPSGHFIRLSPSPTVAPSVSPPIGGGGASNDSLLMIFLVVSVVICGGFGLFALFDSKFEGGKPVAVLLVLVGLVVFVVLLFGIGVL